MKVIKNSLSTIFMALCAIVLMPAQEAMAQNLDVPYVPTRQVVVDAMLDIANVSENDVIYDLGCGDGRIVVTAAKKHGATGTGVDINPERIAEANANAREANVTDKVRFVEGNLFEVDLSEATVVSLYLLPKVNMQLRPKLLQLKPGTRIVSHAFDMGDWEPDQTIEVDGSTIHFWTVPERK
ncbi:class I SAM-dependent methyltransferase [Pontibacter diazotrophicus]|uniref:Class I SAM-dependent methyltransferase n=1 Tax=Pontibacter diazotrophicus TaxID=1400979 RepID=A0A3D8L3I9_9BACT|nr:class I SAM-dependent methyltransferase [Pontibacter diazotrophicus]RDV11978.1 class I SAM-dependent methyltransferase [Pontibacter diazotrophicus]